MPEGDVDGVGGGRCVRSGDDPDPEVVRGWPPGLGGEDVLLEQDPPPGISASTCSAREKQIAHRRGGYRDPESHVPESWFGQFQEALYACMRAEWKSSTNARGKESAEYVEGYTPSGHTTRPRLPRTAEVARTWQDPDVLHTQATENRQRRRGSLRAFLAPEMRR